MLNVRHSGRRASSGAEPHSTSASGRMAGPLMTVPSGWNCEPWHGQSQHCSRPFQWTMQPTWVQTAERSTSVPSSRRNAAILARPRRTIAPSPGFKLLGRGDVAAGQIFGQIGDVLGAARMNSPRLVPGGGLAAWVEQLGEARLLLEQQGGDIKRSGDAVGDALAAVAGVDVDVAVAGVAARVRHEIDRLHHLARPAVARLAERREALAGPGFEMGEALVHVVGRRRCGGPRRRRSADPRRRPSGCRRT